jgi:acetyl esterase/lipase
MKHILDQLDYLEASLLEIKGRLDRSRIAVAGHSMGGHTASMLLGARLTDPEDGTIVDMIEPRIKAGVLLGPLGMAALILAPWPQKIIPSSGTLALLR